jgi:hypothetical protein
MWATCVHSRIATPVPDASPHDAGSLSPRAQEILRRADEQVAGLRRRQRTDAAGGPPEAETPAADAAPAPAAAPAPPREPADLAELLDFVTGATEAAREHLGTLAGSLERIAAALGHAAPVVGAPPEPQVPPGLVGRAMGPPSPMAPSEVAEVVRQAAEAPAPDAAPAQRVPTSAAHDAARLVAIEMAVSGDTREMVGRRLREEFGLSDPKPVLDDVFGRGTASGSRMPWGSL